MKSGLPGRAQWEEVGLKRRFALVLLVLLLSQNASAASYPLTIPFGRSWPLSIVVDSTRGLAYFDATSGDYPPTGFLFGIVNTTSHEVSKVLPLDVVAGPMALDRATGDVYVAGNESIEIFDGGTQTMGRVIEVGRGIVYMTHDGSVSPDIFFTSGNRVFALNPETGAIVNSAAVRNGAGGLALDPETGHLYVAEYPTGEIFVFQASDLSPVGIINLPFCCANRMAVNVRTHTLFATTATNLVDLIDVRAESFVRSVQAAPSNQNSTGDLAVDGTTGRVFVALSPGGSIVELDGATGAVLGSLEAEGQVAGVAVDGVSHELYATNYHQITVFDLGRSSVVLLLLAAVLAVLAVASLAVYFFIRRRDAGEGSRRRLGRETGGEPGQAAVM